MAGHGFNAQHLVHATKVELKETVSGKLFGSFSAFEDEQVTRF